jgi:hypothetical protein
MQYFKKQLDEKQETEIIQEIKVKCQEYFNKYKNQNNVYIQEFDLPKNKIHIQQKYFLKIYDMRLFENKEIIELLCCV